MLDGDRYAAAVRADEEAASQIGVRGVPFFVLGRKYGLSGAQPTEVLAPGAAADLGRGAGLGGGLTMAELTVDIWSDVVCPWCYIGKRRFEAALAQFEHRDDVTVLWHSFELDPDAPPVAEGKSAERLAAKYGMIRRGGRGPPGRDHHARRPGRPDLRPRRVARRQHFDAHRLIHLAAEHRLGDAAMERLMRAYFSEREAIGDRDDAAAPGRRGRAPGRGGPRVLEGERYADAVRADERAATQIGIRGVPFFVLGRKYGVSGAQPAEVLLQALQQAWDEVAGPPVNA